MTREEGQDQDASPDDAKQELIEAAHDIKEGVTEIRSVFSGPMPPPDLLRQYEEIIPGSAERLLAMAEREARHRHTMEQTALQAEVELNQQLLHGHQEGEKRGQRFALTIALVAIIGGLCTVIEGHPIAGTLFGGTGLGLIVIAFIRGKPGPSMAQRNDEQDH